MNKNKKHIEFKKIFPQKYRNNAFYFISKNIFSYFRDFYYLYYACKIKGRNAIYITIPKNANTSIRTAIYHINEGGKEYPKQIYSKYNFPRTTKKEIKKLFVFTFARNPYDRLVSCYENIVKKDNQGIKYENNLGSDLSFKEFVKKVSKIPDWKANAHLKSQYSFIKGMNINFVGKIENLKKDYKRVMKKIGIENPPELQHKRKSKRKKDYRDYYDKETKKLVYERYKKDFELFNYDKEF